MTEPNLQDAGAYIKALTGSSDSRVTFQVFDDNKVRSTKNKSERGYDPFARVIHGTIGERGDELWQLNLQGCGVYLTVNETDLKGREAANIVALRSLFCDFDKIEPGAGDTPNYALKPSITVRSKNGPHPYWPLVPGIPLDVFRQAQKHLAAYYGSDPTVNDLPRVMRLPGFDHRKDPANPYRVTLAIDNDVKYTIEEVLSEHPVQASRIRESEASVMLSEGKKIPPSHRHDALKHYGSKLRYTGLPREAAFAALRTMADTNFDVSDGVKPDAEIEGILDWMYKKVGGEPFDPVSTLPEIEITKNDVENVDAALLSLVGTGIYKRGPTLVRIGGSPLQLHVVTVDALMELLSASAVWKTWRKRDGEAELVVVYPPPRIAKMILARESWRWPFDELLALSDTPIVRPDGTIVQKVGYDAVTKVYYDPGNATFAEVPDSPTAADVDAAYSAIEELIGEFPFVGSSDHSAAIAALLGVLGRTAINGVMPATAFDAPMARTGKGLINEVLSIIAIGQETSTTIFPSIEEEVRKLVFSLARSGTRIINLDNFSKVIDSPGLCSALTSTLIGDRVLMRSEYEKAVNIAAWWLNGNNLQFSGDMPQRVIPCYLNAKTGRPELRTFKIKKLKDYARLHRGRIVAAGLTILRAFFAAGAPGHGKAVLGGFEPWDSVVRSALIWSGQADPLIGQEKLREDSDEGGAALGNLLETIREYLPGWFLVKELINVASLNEDLSDAIAAQMNVKIDQFHKLDSVAVGKMLSSLKNGIRNHMYLEPGVVTRKGREWRIGNENGWGADVPPVAASVPSAGIPGELFEYSAQ